MTCTGQLLHAAANTEDFIHDGGTGYATDFDGKEVASARVVTSSSSALQVRSQTPISKQISLERAEKPPCFLLLTS